MKTSKNKKKKDKRLNQSAPNTFPCVGEVLHHFAKAFDIESELKDSKSFSPKKIERFWTGETQEYDRETAEIRRSHFNEIAKICFGPDADLEIINKRSAVILERYELIARKVTIYNATKVSIDWALLSRFWVPFMIELSEEINIPPKKRQHVLALLQEENPIQVVFDKLVRWTAASNWQEILAKLRTIPRYDPDKVETDWLRKRLERLR